MEEPLVIGVPLADLAVPHGTLPVASRPDLDPAPVLLYDKRLAQRVSFRCEVCVHWEDVDLPGTTMDVSMHGARIRLHDQVALSALPATGTHVEATLVLHGAPVRFRSRIAHRRLDHAVPIMGLNFMAVESNHERFLQSVVLQGTPV